MINTFKDTRGMALVISMLIMAVASMMAIGIATDSTIDGQISRNQRDTTKDFFIADGTNQLETIRIITDFSLDNIIKPVVLQNDTTEKDVPGVSSSMPNRSRYLAKTNYHFYRATIKAGYQLGKFNSYYYSTNTTPTRKQLSKPGVKTLVTQFGPKI